MKMHWNIRPTTIPLYFIFLAKDLLSDIGSRVFENLFGVDLVYGRRVRVISAYTDRQDASIGALERRCAPRTVTVILKSDSKFMVYKPQSLIFLRKFQL